MNKKISSVLISVILTLNFSYAGNPIITNIFTADAAAMVYNDTVYLYTGHDEASTSASGYSMNDWQCFSSTDMINWTSHGEVLNVSAFSWSKGDAWAAEVEERNGKFYYYICTEHKTIAGKAIGVAVADKPTGPFVDAIGSALVTNSMTWDDTHFWDDIDPTCYIDGDGQAYLYWGNSRCYYVKLKENMIELDGSVVEVSLPSFTEAPYLHKKDSIYYLSYAYSWPEQIAYATSSSITGPWTYKGIINDVIENCGTNHQSIINYKNQWYFIYHSAGLPTGTEYRRSVCVDYLFYNSDGTIKKVVQTTESVQNADSTALCPVASLNTKIKVNSNIEISSREELLIIGDTLTLTIEPSESGTCSWSGPNNFKGSTNTITINDITLDHTGIYSATFINSCGTNSYANFNITVEDKKPESIDQMKYYVIKPLNSELVLSVQNGLSTNGANVIVDSSNNEKYQHWKFINTSEVFWKITPEHIVSRGLDVYNGLSDDGTNVGLWDYWGGEMQKWIIGEKEPGIYQIKSKISGKCLDVASLTAGANVRQWACNDSKTQKFTLEEAIYNKIAFKINSNNFNIFPNPSTGKFQIELMNHNSNYNIEILDLSGKIVYKLANITSKIFEPDIELKGGTYIVKVYKENFINTKKLINK